MSKIALVKIHPGLNMALPQLSGDLVRAGHETWMYFFKDYLLEREYLNSSFSVDFPTKGDKNFDEVYGEEYRMLLQVLNEFKPDAIALSVISLSIPEAAKTSAFLRNHFDCPILWGGVGTTLEPETAIQHADLVCIGEGEEVLVEFADCLDNGSDWSEIKGTWTRGKDGSVKRNEKRPLCELDDIAVPEWNHGKMWYITEEKYRKGVYAHNLLTNGGDYQIMTQRGCPFSCSFCVESRYQEMFGKKKSLRRRNVDIVLDELKWAKENHDPEVIWFWDDVFTLNPRWLDAFLPRLKEEVDLPFWCYTYPTTHSLDLLKTLKANGGNCISMGIQSGSERILKDVYNRPTPLPRVIEAAQEIVEAGIVGYFDLITKSSFETEEDLRSTFNFLIDLPQEMVYLGAGQMMSYPTYAYTHREAEANVADVLATSAGNNDTLLRVDEKLYDYYHRLYWVARNPFIDSEEKRKIGAEPMFRETPELLQQYIYVETSLHVGLQQMRVATATAVHPYHQTPLPQYKHVPIDQGYAAISLT